MLNNALIRKSLNDTKRILKLAGLLDVVTVSVEDQQQENGTNIKVLAGCYEGSYGNEVHTEELYSGGTLSSNLFTGFFTQRKDWLLASQVDRNACFDQSIHPAFFHEYKGKINA